MTAEKFDNFSSLVGIWKKKLINFGLQRDLLDKELENMIVNLLKVESQIFKSLIEARIYSDEQRQSYNYRIEQLKNKSVEDQKFLDYFKTEVDNLPEPKKPKEIITSIEHMITSIKNIDQKINSLKEKLIEEILNITQENKVLEDLKVLEIQKQTKIDELIILEQDLKSELKNNVYFRTQRSIEILEINMKLIKKNLKKWTEKRTEGHKIMLSLYRKAKAFEIIQKQMENELNLKEKSANKYHQQFNDLINQNKNKILEELFVYLKSKKKPEKIKPKLKVIDKELIKRKKSRKKFMKKKLAIAIDKKKAGKRLNFYELKLILDHSKKENN